MYQKAAKLGDCVAQYNPAEMYEKGDGIKKKDVYKVIGWYKKSAKQSDRDAQNKYKKLERYKEIKSDTCKIN